MDHVYETTLYAVFEKSRWGSPKFKFARSREIPKEKLKHGQLCVRITCLISMRHFEHFLRTQCAVPIPPDVDTKAQT